MTQTFNPGDLVRSTGDSGDQRRIGDVFTVQESPNGTTDSDMIWYAPKTGIGPSNLLLGSAKFFELIARAGEPVKYLPGDVVEFISKSAEIRPGRYTNMTRVIGQRYTLCDPAYAPNGSGSLHFVDTYNGGSKTWAPPSYFKLVHRPEPAKEPLTFTVQTWRGHREGDTVRVEFQGVLTSIRPSSVVFNEPGSTEAIRVGVDASVFTAEVERPLAVGDRVRSKTTHRAGEIMATTNEHAWLKVSPRSLFTERLDNLERVS